LWDNLGGNKNNPIKRVQEVKRKVIFNYELFKLRTIKAFRNSGVSVFSGIKIYANQVLPSSVVVMFKDLSIQASYERLRDIKKRIND
jgi:hypothetical protein